MINISKTDLDIVINILKEHVPDKEVRVFGSRYKGTNKPYSDLDLAIVGNNKLTLLEIGELQEAFENSDLPFRVDVVDYNCVSDEFKKIINSGYEVITNKIDQFD